jgi:hypothetical protein
MAFSIGSLVMEKMLPMQDSDAITHTPPLATDSRIEMRLLSETKSVLEYPSGSTARRGIRGPGPLTT